MKSGPRWFKCINFVKCPQKRLAYLRTGQETEAQKQHNAAYFVRLAAQGFALQAFLPMTLPQLL